MKKYFLLLLLGLLFCSSSVHAQENGIIVSPLIIDAKVLAGDILKYDIKISNHTEQRASIYAMVNDISEVDGVREFLSPSSLDQETSVARWISFSRGVIELGAGEEINIPLRVDVGSQATPGKRFARIAFPSNSNRQAAEDSMTEDSFAQLLINIEVTENIIEKAQIQDFSARTNVFLSAPVSFQVKLNNFGNKPITPTGNLFIYNRRGVEIANLEVNAEGESVSSNEAWEKDLDWTDFGGLGKYKAKLELEYGDQTKRDMQDTVFFWIFPWKILLAFFLGTFVFLALMITLIFRRSYVIHHQVQPVASPRRKVKVKTINLKNEE